jgi:ribose transport system substrate-binding protein
MIPAFSDRRLVNCDPETAVGSSLKRRVGRAVATAGQKRAGNLGQKTFQEKRLRKRFSYALICSAAPFLISSVHPKRCPQDPASPWSRSGPSSCTKTQTPNPKLMIRRLLCCFLTLSVCSSVFAKEVKSVGISLGSLGNPGFVLIAKVATAELKKINPNVNVTVVGYDYDLGKQFTEIDNFIAAGVDFIILNPGDPKAIAPAIKKAQAAGIPVVAVDTVADGADAAVTTDNVQAGSIAGQYIADRLKGKGDVIIENGPQVSSVIDRVDGVKQVLAKYPGIKVLSDDQDGKGSRDGGLAVAQGYLTRFPHIDAVFTINDPQAIGTALAAQQSGRTDFFISSVDGSPDIEAALKDPKFKQIETSSSQDFHLLPKLAVKLGVDLINGKKPDKVLTLVPSSLVTRDNVAQYKGWNAQD